MSEQAQESKELKLFEANKSKLISLLGGGDLLRKRQRGAKTDVQKAMESLLADKKAGLVEEIKKDTSSLIESYISFDSFQKEKRKEFDKAIEEKHKEFNKMAEAVFAKMSGVEELERAYLEALTAAATPRTSSTQPAPGE